MSRPKESESSQQLPPEVAKKDSCVPENISLIAPCSGHETNRPSNVSCAAEGSNMRTCCPSELSLRNNTDTRIGAMDNPIQEENTPEMEKGPPEVSSTASATSMMGKESLEKNVDFSRRKGDQVEKQGLSRTGDLNDPPHEGFSTPAATPSMVETDMPSLRGVHGQANDAPHHCLTKPSQESQHKLSTSTQEGEISRTENTDSPTESITKKLVSLEMSQVPSLGPQAQIEKFPENRRVEAAQPWSKDTQVPLPTELKKIGPQPAGDLHIKQSQANVRLSKNKDCRDKGKTGQVINMSSKPQDAPPGEGASVLSSPVCKSTKDLPGDSVILETASKQSAKLTTKTKTCDQEGKHVFSHPHPQSLCSDLSQGALHKLTSETSSCTMDTVKEGTHKDHTDMVGIPVNLSKPYTPEDIPPQHNIGTQAGTRVECRSVAVSPIVPPGGSSSFTFQIHVGKRGPSSPKGSPKGPPGKKVARTVDTASKAGSFELAHPQQDVGTQACTRVECKSVAVSPIILPGGSSSFSFQTDKVNPWSPAVKNQTVGKDTRAADTLSKTPSFELTPPQQDVGTQAGTRVECKSAAVSPIIPPGASSSFPFQEVMAKIESPSRKNSLSKDQVGGKDVRTVDTLSKTSSFKLAPPQQEAGSQADTRVECKSVAVSPIIFPSDGPSSFTFQADNEKEQSTPLKSPCSKRHTISEEVRAIDTLSKTCSFELTPPQQDVGTQAGTRAECKSVAVSPIIPPDGASSFTFQENEGSQVPSPSKSTGEDQPKVVHTVTTVSKMYSFELTPPQQDEGTQVDTRVECKSVAISPIIPPDGSSSFSFQTDKANKGSPSKQLCLQDQAGTSARTADTLSKTYSFELTPPQQDVGIQVSTRVECKSVAISPIIPPDGSTTFTFQAAKNQESPSLEKPLIKDPSTDRGTRAGDALSKTCSVELSQPQQDVGTQAGTRPECVSVAVSPIIPPDGSSSFTFQECKEKHPASLKISSDDDDQTGRKETQSADTPSKACSFKGTAQQDVGTQVGARVECKSAAVSPIIPPGEASSFPFPTDGANQGSACQNITSGDPTGIRGARHMDMLSKEISFEITPPQQDVGIQVDTIVHCVHMAVSPIIPPDGSTSFTFQTGIGNQEPPSMSTKLEMIPSRRDAEMQVSIYAEMRSVATGPMTPMGKFPQNSYPEVRVKGAKGDKSEPVREVSWDEKGMTWEVYGASMEVEVLGQAIQKHLEKQIEEHGRQKVMTPQNTRASSIRGAPVKVEVKRQPSMFRALLHNMRGPRCCSRAGPTAE